MSTIEDGGPAFPVSTSNEQEGHQDGPNTWQFPGMTLRDYFAAKAMTALIAINYADGDIDDRLSVMRATAAESYEFADAMLAARKEKP